MLKAATLLHCWTWYTAERYWQMQSRDHQGRCIDLCICREWEQQDWITSSIVSRIAFGFPGKFMIRVLPRNPAVCRESTAVGTCLHKFWCIRHDQVTETVLLF